jgi:hypothetical protein
MPGNRRTTPIRVVTGLRFVYDHDNEVPSSYHHYQAFSRALQIFRFGRKGKTTPQMNIIRHHQSRNRYNCDSIITKVDDSVAVVFTLLFVVVDVYSISLFHRRSGIAAFCGIYLLEKSFHLLAG